MKGRPLSHLLLVRAHLLSLWRNGLSLLGDGHASAVHDHLRALPHLSCLTNLVHLRLLCVVHHVLTRSLPVSVLCRRSDLRWPTSTSIQSSRLSFLLCFLVFARLDHVRDPSDGLGISLRFGQKALRVGEDCRESGQEGVDLTLRKVERSAGHVGRYRTVARSEPNDRRGGGSDGYTRAGGWSLDGCGYLQTKNELWLEGKEVAVDRGAPRAVRSQRFAFAFFCLQCAYKCFAKLKYCASSGWHARLGICMVVISCVTKLWRLPPLHAGRGRS